MRKNHFQPWLLVVAIVLLNACTSFGQSTSAWDPRVQNSQQDLPEQGQILQTHALGKDPGARVLAQARQMLTDGVIVAGS